MCGARLPHPTAHPRSRGENSTGDMESEAALGSSPLTRGKRNGTDLLFREVRLIPAHAGKTDRPHVVRPQSGAHPRSRGENGVLSGRAVEDAGSSPLTRGKQSSETHDLARKRLIPAHAGKTRPADRLSLQA